MLSKENLGLMGFHPVCSSLLLVVTNAQNGSYAHQVRWVMAFVTIDECFNFSSFFRIYIYTGRFLSVFNDFCR